MKNIELLNEKLDNALDYLYQQEQRLKPFLEKLEKILNTNMKEELITPQEAFEMYCSIQKQYTDSILLISKIQEIINYKEKF